MGLLDIANKLNPANLLSGAVETLCDKMGLPEAVGDMASGAVNCLTGNYAGLLEDAVDLSDNLKKGLAGFLEGFFSEEPEAPTRKDGSAIDHLKDLEGLSALLDQLKQRLTLLHAQSQERGGVAGRADEIETKSSHLAVTDEPGSAGGAADTPAASDNAKTADEKGSVDKFINMKPEDFKRAIREGKLPEDLSDEQMFAIQERMQHLNRMFSFMTNMMQAQHETTMALIRNLRV